MFLRVVPFGCSLLCALSVHAQNRVFPISARMRQVNYRVAEDGARTLLRDSIGAFYRGSDGSQIMTYYPNPDQSSTVQYSTLTDAKKMVVYHVDHASGRAIVKTRMVLPFPQHIARVSADRVLGTHSSKALPCTIINPSAVHKRDRQCVSYEYDLIVWRETILPKSISGAQDLVTIMELVDIQIGKEPSPELLRIPSSYQILETSPNQR